MVDLKLLSKLGVNRKTLKAAFTAKKPSDEITSWIETQSGRIKAGVEDATRDYRLYLAIDSAIDSPFFQKSYTLFQGLLNNKWDSKKVLSTLKDWGAGSWIKSGCGCGNKCTDLNTCTAITQTADIPTFFDIDFPICLAYLRIRVARLYNERNLNPLLLYTPRMNTAEERLRAEIFTHRMDVQSEQMNYRSVLKQVILQSTGYGVCVTFPKEAWWADQQPTEEMKGKKRVMRTEKEGIRYEHPHPCRMYYDLAHPAYTLNTGTGCRFGGYWSLVPYGDVDGNAEYWNTDDISFGKDAFRITESNRMFFETVYPCSMSFPTYEEDGASPVVGKIDRQKRMNYYTQADRDKAVLLTNHFVLVNPLRDWGLKNKDGEGYDGDVWFRTSFSGYNTVIHVEPLAYRPMTWSGYDADANRYRNPSIVLETIPAQDMIHNLFSQAILQAKNNLANVNFYNTDAIGEDYVKQIEGFGEKAYRRPIFIPFSAHESRSMGQEKRDAIIPVTIRSMPISDLIGLVNGILNLLDKSLGMSPQEIGSAASHEQSAHEVGITAQSTSTRLAYTGSFIDDWIHAFQVQNAEAGLAYWDDEIVAQVAMMEEADAAVLKKMGFEIESRNTAERTAGVRGKKKALETSEFTVRRDARERVNNPAMAAQMVQFFTAFSNNPLLMQAIGTGQVVKVFNMLATFFAFPKDFRLSAIHDPIKDAKEDKEKALKQQAEQASGELAKILPQMAEKIKAETLQMVGQQLKPVFEKSAAVDQQQSEQIQQLAQGAEAFQQQAGAAITKLMQLMQAATQPQPQVVPQGAGVMPPGMMQ